MNTCVAVVPAEPDFKLWLQLKKDRYRYHVKAAKECHIRTHKIRFSSLCSHRTRGDTITNELKSNKCTTQHNIQHTTTLKDKKTRKYSSRIMTDIANGKY